MGDRLMDWGKVLGAAEIAGGIIGAPFTGGASLALVGAGVGTLGSSIAAGKQQAAGQQALGQQQQVYQQQQQNLSPYMGLGAGAVNKLAYGAGIALPQSQPLAGATGLPATTDATPPPAAPAAPQTN